MRVQCFFFVLVLATSIFMSGCYTQFATSNSIARISSPSEVDVEELVENGRDVTINNYYDIYHAHFLRPAIYGFTPTWGWYDPFWGYPLWYTPIFVPVAYYGWGGVWGWNRWIGWNPYFPPVWGGTVASTTPLGTRRTGIGRMRTTGADAPIFTPSSSIRGGSSSESGTVAPSSRRQRTGTATTAPTDASRYNRRTREAQRPTTYMEHVKPSSEPTRRTSSGERRTSSYSAPSPRSSPPASSSSRGAGSSSGSSSSSSSGRRQR